MASKTRPKLSIGLPVYNGDNYLKEALDSLLSQTYSDFEIIISDNASVDRTQEICCDYQQLDSRIRYYRNNENKGATWNLNRVFHLSTGDYFKWAAHDDLCKPTLLSKSIEILENKPTTVLCYARTISINSHGELIKEWEPRPEFAALSPRRRFRESLNPTETFPIWGTIRSKVLKKTKLLGDFPEHDRPLIAELSLHGLIYELPEYLFIRLSKTS
jgi:glycosyltransferase involved in cell wall biosynthesis